MLTQRGRAFIFVLIFSLFICWYTEARLSYFITALLLSALVVSYLFLKSGSINNINCIRKVSSYAYEGENLDVKLTITNKGNFREDFVKVSDSFQPEIYSSKKEAFIEEFSKGNSLDFLYNGKCVKRGVYALGPCVLERRDFFGFFKKEKRLYPESKLAVFPRPFKVNSFPLGLRTSAPRYGDMSVRRAGDYEEFYGVREYSKESGLKKVHWGISAKHNKLMVRHFEQSSTYMGTLILNLKESDNLGNGKDTTLEYAIKIAVSISKYLIEKGGAIQLLAYQDKPIISAFGKSREHFVKISEVLASLEAHSQVDFSASLARLSPLIPPSSSLIVFIFDNDTQSQALLDSLAIKKDIFITEIVMLSSSFANQKRLKNMPRSYYCSANLFKYFVGYQDALDMIFSKSVEYI